MKSAIYTDFTFIRLIWMDNSFSSIFFLTFLHSSLNSLFFSIIYQSFLFKSEIKARINFRTIQSFKISLFCWSRCDGMVDGWLSEFVKGGECQWEWWRKSNHYKIDKNNFIYYRFVILYYIYNDSLIFESLLLSMKWRITCIK